jgi:hypothetical protein
VLPLTVIALAMATVLALPVLSAGWLLGTRSAVQRAADAAALAGAGQAIVAAQSDARGNLYCEDLAVDPVQGPATAARYWTRNARLLLSLQTESFVALPAGRTLQVLAIVRAPGGGLVFAGASRVTWTVTAEAEIVQPSGVPTC